ncbi:MAG: extracellular solute-binding protein [Clostridia bacterium]|nr:extracellular solute-binding protein [Clostridia bacterium]
MKHRFLCFAAALMMLLAACTPALAETAQADFVIAGFDGQDTQRSWANNAFFAGMASRTGVTLAYQQYATAAEWQAAKADMLKSGTQLPDALFKASLSREEERNLLDAGVLIDLKPLLEAHCPNLWQILTEHPEVAAGISLADGQIVSLPYINFAATQNCMWINRKWLDQLKLSAPTDLEGLEAVLRAFKTRDPNTNGRNDEIPLAFLGVFDLNFLSHAFGFIMNDYHIYAKDGQAVFAPMTDEWVEMIRWLRDMYAEGLLDHNGFYTNDTVRAITRSDTAQIYGIFLNTALTNLVPAEWVADYQLLMPLVYDGTQRYRSFMGTLITGTFAVTSACKDPGRVLEWVDTLYSESGAILASIGSENVDYVIDGDGTWRLIQNYNSSNVYSAETLINSGNAAPGIRSDEFQLRYSDATISRVVKDTLQVNEYCELPFPQCFLTTEQADFIAPLQNAIGLETDLQASRWILGEDKLDDGSVAAFREKLNGLGLEEFMGFWKQRLNEIQ